jgi:hypothetical protein
MTIIVIGFHSNISHIYVFVNYEYFHKKFYQSAENSADGGRYRARTCDLQCVKHS